MCLPARVGSNVRDWTRRGRILPLSLQERTPLPTSWFQTSAPRLRENKRLWAWLQQLPDAHMPRWAEAEPHPPLVITRKVLFPPPPLPSAPSPSFPSPLVPPVPAEMFGVNSKRWYTWDLPVDNHIWASGSVSINLK